MAKKQQQKPQEEEKRREQKKFKYQYHKFIRLDIWALVILALLIFLIRGAMLRPYINKDKALTCEYHSKFNKIICTQLGEVVPEWLILDDGVMSDNYSMFLIFKKKEEYKSYKMTDKVFIDGFKRKFIYEIEEQTLTDFRKFKKFAKDADVKSWGTVLLYCSEENIADPICKNMKKYHR